MPEELRLEGQIDVNTVTHLFHHHREGGGVSRVNIGSVITASVTSRHTSLVFKMAGKFLVRYFAKDVKFAEIWMLLLPYSM